ncbi:hypothetical protein ACA910_013958 [Epithemia clementina (nom. ined.)]
MPLCAACQFGKQTRRPTPGKISHAVQDRDGILKKDNRFPGQRVSVDHFVCATKGRLLESFGKTNPKDMYDGGCIFVDHASGYTHITMQAHLNTHGTLQSKESFELLCRNVGVVPQEYLTYNGSAFKSRDYTASLVEFRQIYCFAGTGTHHQNGVAERAIRSIMNIARTMMLHAAIHWNETADPTIWPTAVLHAVWLFNHVPSISTAISPQDIFTRTRFPQCKFHDLHVWGCPTYVLHKKISDSMKLPCWQPRSDRCMFVGLSPTHATNVPLVLNLQTGAITPQFHVVFDDWFATVTASVDDLPDFQSPEWAHMFGDSTFLYPEDVDDNDLSDSTPPDLELAVQSRFQQDAIHDAIDTAHPPTPLPLPPRFPSSAPVSAPSSASPPSLNVDLVWPSPPSSTLPFTPSLRRQRENSTLTDGSSPQREQSSQQREPPASQSLSIPTPQPSASPSPPVSNVTHHQRSGCTTKQPSRLIDTMNPKRKSKANICQFNDMYAPTDNNDFSLVHEPFGTPCSPQLLQAFLFASNIPNPDAYKASASDPDTLTFDQAMSSPDKHEWIKAANLEIAELVAKGTWTEVFQSEAHSKILPGTWVFRRKRRPDGTIKKYKARSCVRGDLQEGDFETFAPVVAWSTICTVFVFAITMRWEMLTVDFTNAFVQAALQEPIWIHVPRGFRVVGQTEPT